MKASDLVIGREVKILRGGYAGYTGTIVNFDVDEDQVDVEISGTNKIRYLGINDIKLIDPFKNVFKKYENQNNKINMKNLVFESLDELFESKKAEAKEKPKKEDKPKPTNAAKEKAKAEKKKPVKVDQGKKEKYEQAIKGLEAELAKAKKPGAFKLVSDKKMKIQELQDKIKAWKKKLANLK